MSHPPARIEAFGDAAVLVTLGGALDAGLNGRARGLATAVEARRSAGARVGRAVAAHGGVLVPFDPLELAPSDARALLADLVAAIGAAAGGPEAGTGAAEAGTEDPGTGTFRLHEIPVRYGGEDGPDLDATADLLGLTSRELVEVHAGTTYEVLFLGFAPGFGYLGPLPGTLEAPRLEAPRPRVAAGSVAIAGRQTAVYPFALPGGWRLIGRTETQVWDVRRDPPAVFAPGDRVRFIPLP